VSSPQVLGWGGLSQNCTLSRNIDNRYSAGSTATVPEARLAHVLCQAAEHAPLACVHTSRQGPHMPVQLDICGIAQAGEREGEGLQSGPLPACLLLPADLAPPPRKTAPPPGSRRAAAGGAGAHPWPAGC
jgi:hypothetical protein